MTNLEQLGNLLNWAALATSAGAAMVLWRRGLNGVYRALFLMLASRAGTGLILAATPPGTNTAFRTWAVLQAIGWVLTIYVILEFSSLALRDYPGLARFGRRAFTAMLATAILVGVLSLQFGAGAGAKNTQYVSLIVNLNRGLDWAAALFLAGILLFMSFYSAPLNRNMARHGLTLFLYYVPVSLASLYYIVNGLSARGQANAAASAISAGCNVAWAICLTGPGERKPGRGIGYRVAEDQAARRLRELNDAMRVAQPGERPGTT